MQFALDIAHVRVYLLATMDDEYGNNTCFCQVGSAQDALDHYFWCSDGVMHYVQSIYTKLS